VSDPRWEHFEHGSDIGIRGHGSTLEEAFEQAALALTAVLTDPALVGASIVVDVQCNAPDRELLLVDWLNALVYEMATRRALFARFEVTIEGNELHARAWGAPVERSRHAPAVEIKGATYTELRVSRDAQGWVAQCVVDV
jgi:SHS2 domain-containing protein